jgi:hypothetical protein
MSSVHDEAIQGACMLKKNNNLPSNQAGASALAILIIVAMAAMILLVVFKLYPIYFEHWQIQSVVESFEEESGVEELSVGEVAKRFKLRMQTNNVRDVRYDDAIEIYKEDGILTIDVDYERRINIYKNVDAVVVFQDVTEINP